MSSFLSEAELESALLEQFAGLGYACTSDDIVGPDGKAPEREAYDQVVLERRLSEAVARLNPVLPAEARTDAVRRVTQTELPNLLEENRRIHRLLTEGLDVEYYGDDLPALGEARQAGGVLTAGKVGLIDFERPANNDWLAVQQLTVISGPHKRRKTFEAIQRSAPPPAILAAFERLVSGWFDATLSSVVKSRTLAKLRNTLVPKLISGELRIADAKGFLEKLP